MELFTKKSIGISIDRNTLVLCQVIFPNNQRPQITSISSSTIPKECFVQGRIIYKKGFVKTLQNALKNAKPNPITSKDIVMEIPESVIFQKKLTLPTSIEGNQLPEAIFLETEKTLPFSADQISWDYQILNKNEKKQRILFTAAPLEIVQEYYEMLIEAGYTPIGFSIRSENLIRAAVQHNSPESCMIDLQNRFTSLTFFRGTKKREAHQINIGEHHFKKAIQEHLQLTAKTYKQNIHKLSSIDINLATLKPMKKLWSEIKKHLSQQKEHKNKKDFIYIGNTVFFNPLKQFFSEQKSSLKELNGAISKIIKIKPVDPETLTIFTGEDEGKDKKRKNTLQAKTQKEQKTKTKTPTNEIEKTGNYKAQKLLPSAVGSALADYAETDPGEKPINLLPKVVRSIAVWKETNPWFYVMTSILLIFSIGWLMAFGFVWGNTTAQLRVAKENLILLERQFENIKPLTIEERIESANKELQVISNIQQSKNPHAIVLQTIRDLLPSGTTFTSLEFGHLQNKNLFELRGTAENRELVIEIHERLQQHKLVNQVLFPASNLDEKSNSPFSIQFTINHFTPNQ
jgi:Tfp pilus assembly PilM family ATPase/Tfp pilus assembly protein PilN